MDRGPPAPSSLRVGGGGARWSVYGARIRGGERCRGPEKSSEGAAGTPGRCSPTDLAGQLDRSAGQKARFYEDR